MIVALCVLLAAVSAPLLRLAASVKVNFVPRAEKLSRSICSTTPGGGAKPEIVAWFHSTTIRCARNKWSKAVEQPVKSQPMTKCRVFNVSLHRSGTKSFIDLCVRNKLRSLWWPGIGFDLLCRPALHNLDRRYIWNLYKCICEGHDAFADLPVPLLYRELMAEAPDAKFLLILRPAQDWVRSVRRRFQGQPLNILPRFLYSSLGARLVKDLGDLSDEVLEGAYESFNCRVAEEAKAQGVRFETFQLNDPQIGRKLAKYIGLELTDEFRNFDTLMKR